ncbi:MAG: glycosyltransferase [Candidatus Sericytochromatia bacterium]|nr:glycosyltransferase [Candidatus Sericytochromatia bacterium]
MPAVRPRIEPLAFSRAPSLAISIIVVVQAIDESLQATLVDLREARLPLSYEVILVVASEDASRLVALRQDFPLLLVYQASPGTSLGGLYDIGIRAAGGRHLLLLDGSARPTSSAVQDMVRFADGGQWIGAVVPRYVTEQGQDRPSCRFFPTPLSACREALGGHPLVPRLHYAFNRLVTTPKEIDAAEGGCVLIRRAAMLDVGGMAAAYPAGGEMWDWCMRAKLKGWGIFLHPGSEAVLCDPTQQQPPMVRRESIRRFVYRFYGWLPTVLVTCLMVPFELKDRVLFRKRVRKKRPERPVEKALPAC